MDGMGTTHYVRTEEGPLVRHEGPSGGCTSPGCQWPRIGGMVTVTSAGRKVTGSLVRKDEWEVQVKTADGLLHDALRTTVEKPEWGTYCPHGTKLIESEGAEHTCHLPKEPCDRKGELGHLCIDHQPWCRACYPEGRKIVPWPCLEEGCTEADFDREMQEREEVHYKEMRRSY